jgi:hypothetical protein
MFWKRKKKTKELIEFQKTIKELRKDSPKDASEVVISSIGGKLIERLEKVRTEKIINGEL